MGESPELAQSFSVLTAGRYLRDRLAGTGSLGPMAYTVDFKDVSTVGLESSPVADALAGLRANEARYFKNKYDHDFTVEPASKAKKAIAYVHKILENERGI